MKYGLLALMLLAFIPGCSCMRKDEGQKGKPAKQMQKKQAPKKAKKAMPKKAAVRKPAAQRPMPKAAPRMAEKAARPEMEEMDVVSERM